MNSKRRFVALYFGFQFSFSMLFWMPIFFEYQKRVGLTEPEIFQIQSFYYFIFCVIGIPTGYLSDRFGHLRSMVLGSVVLILANLIPIFFFSYGAWILHWFGIAVARSFVAGASSAYLYEFLRAKNLSHEYKRIEGQARALSLVGRVACFAVIGYLMEIYLPIPYILTAAIAVVAVVLAMKLPAIVETAAVIPEQVSLRAGMALVARSKWLIFLILQGIALFVLGRIVVVNLFQPILESKNVSLAHYGLVMAIITVFEAVGSAKPDWCRKWMTDLTSVFWLSIGMGLTLAVIPWTGMVGAVASLSLFSLFAGLSYPIQKQLMNDAIPDARYRATILSAESIVDRIVCSGVAFALERVALQGRTASDGGFDSFILISGFGSAALMFLLWMLLPLLRRRA